MLLGLAIAAALFLWAFVGLAGHAYPTATSLVGLAKAMYPSLTKHFDDPGEREAWIIREIAGLFVIIGLAAFFFGDKEGFWFGFWPEFVGIGVTVLGIDELNRRRSEQELKQQTFRQIRFSSNAFAIEALQVARHMGWIDEIIKPGANLEGANLEGANLEGANLEGANLQRANLQRAHLENANLRGANLCDTNFEEAFLFGANLEDALLIQAFLKGVMLQTANLKGASLVRANLEWTALHETNLLEVNLRDAKFEWTLYDDATVWPEKFDLKSIHAFNVNHWTKEQVNDRWEKYRSTR